MKKIIVILAFSILIGASVYAQDILDIVRGRILLQVEESGEAWYVNPDDDTRYYMGRPHDAFELMRAFGLGIAHSELQGYLNTAFPSRLSGKILIDVEMNGEAYYVYPLDLKGYYLGRPQHAFDIMRSLSLGITNEDLSRIPQTGETPMVTGVVDTGQSTCFNSTSETTCPVQGFSYYGQDAQYSGAQPSYTNNGDGTITDNITGLMWQQDPGSKMSYTNAVNGADSFTLAGYSDWRLPTIKELYSLILFSGKDISSEQGSDTSGFTPFINTDFFEFEYGDTSAGDRLIDSQWTTSSVYESDVMNGQQCFFGVNFADGRIKCYPTQGGKGYFTIYVRGNSYGNNDYVDNGNNTITDDSTGLQWMKNDSAQGMIWLDALEYCEELNFAGYDDWRLPNAKELQSIVDYTRSPDTTNSPAIDSIFQTSSITNESGQLDYPFFWTSTTHASEMGGNTAAYISFGRAMGYMQNSWIDVHGAGAQRSDPKAGNPNNYPYGRGPQGDAIRIYNYVRCVR